MCLNIDDITKKEKNPIHWDSKTYGNILACHAVKYVLAKANLYESYMEKRIFHYI